MDGSALTGLFQVPGGPTLHSAITGHALSRRPGARDGEAQSPRAAHFFQDHGSRGRRAALGCRDIHARDGLKKHATILAHPDEERRQASPVIAPALCIPIGALNTAAIGLGVGCGSRSHGAGVSVTALKQCHHV